jgi:peptidyl-prolyl cis-trans isomerase D
MLDQMRKSSQSLAIYVLFGIVIAVFIINFGPQSRGGSCEEAMGGNENYAARVSGETISSATFRYGFMLSGGAQVPAKYAKQERLKETVLDRLIERELLAAEADRLGFAVTEDEVNDQIVDSKIIGLGAMHTVPRLQKDGRFDYEAFKRFVQLELGVTPKAFIEEQKKELLASRARDLLRGGVSVSPDEVKTEFLRKNRQVNLEYMRFAGRRFESMVAPTDAEIAEYASKNDASLRAAYDQRKAIYEKVPPQRRLRQILIKVASDAKPDAEKKAKAKAEALAEKIRRGAKVSGKEGVTFLEVARDSSEDAASKMKGGDLGWRAKGATNLSGDNEEKVWNAKPGQIVGPLRGSEGFVITKVEAAREGEVPFDKAKLELAEEKVREVQANAKAKAAAEAALAKAKEAEKQTKGSTLKALFPAASDTDEASASAAGNAPVPRVEETGLFALRATREGTIVEGVGVSAPLAKAAFGLTADAALAGPFDVAGSLVIVRLKERKDPDLAELDKKMLELQREAELAKSERVLSDWTQARCVEAKKAKQIVVNTDMLRYEDSTEAPAYEPCSGHRTFGG